MRFLHTEAINISYPSITHPGYLVLKPLSKQLLSEVVQFNKEGRKSKIIIDVGCGYKPYLPCFASVSSAYWGVDSSSDSSADVRGSNYNLPFKEAVADVVLCTQVLEHCEHPYQVLSEISRILRPGGISLLSTHGVFIYHPSPGDYWRWTHEGLRVTFKAAGLQVSQILSNGGPIACLFYLSVTLLSMFTYQSRYLAPIRYFFVPLFNFLGEKLDSFFIRYLYPKANHLLIANYLVVSNKPA